MLSTVDSLLELDSNLVVIIVVADPDHRSEFKWKLGELWEVLRGRRLKSPAHWRGTEPRHGDGTTDGIARQTQGQVTKIMLASTVELNAVVGNGGFGRDGHTTILNSWRI